MFALSRSRAALLAVLLAAPCLALAESETIRLARRGKTGDVYKFQATTRTKGEIDMSSSPDPILQDVTRTKTVSEKFLGVGKDGTLRFETRLLSGKKTSIEAEKTLGETLPPFDVVFSVSPDNAHSSAKALPLPVEKGKPKPLSAEAINRAIKDANDFFIEPPFPTRLLRVGETWTGVVPKNPLNKDTAGDRDIPYTATLAAVETHRGVPCARVTYIMTYKGDQESFRAAILKTAPEESLMQGDSEVNGTATIYYSLDRGATLDSDIKIKTKYKYKVGIPIEGTEELRVIDVEGETNFEDKVTALTFPTYDAALRGK